MDKYRTQDTHTSEIKKKNVVFWVIALHSVESFVESARNE